MENDRKREIDRERAGESERARERASERVRMYSILINIHIHGKVNGVNRIVQDDGGCAAGGSARGQGGAAETKTDQKANDDAPVILDIVEHVYIYA